MTVDSLLASLVAKYNGIWVSGNYNASIGVAAGALVATTIKEPWVYYITEIIGYVSEQAVAVSIYDINSNVMNTWQRFPDVNVSLNVVPIIHVGARLTGRRSIGPASVKDTATFAYFISNSSGNITDFNIADNGFVIHRDNADAFEEEYKKLYKFGRE